MCLFTGKIYCFRVSIVVALCLTIIQIHVIKEYYNGGSVLVKPRAQNVDSYRKNVAEFPSMDLSLHPVNGKGTRQDKYEKESKSDAAKDVVVVPAPPEKPEVQGAHAWKKPKGRVVKKTPSTMRLLLLFSSWDYNSEKVNVHSTIMKLWGSWRPLVKPVVFTMDRFIQTEAIKFKWDVLPVVRNPKCKGPPVLTKFYTHSFQHYDAKFYGFANSDIAFGNGLVQTLQYIRNSELYANKSVLIVGRRTNFDFVNYKGVIDNPDKIKELLPRGNLVVKSTDYFFTNKYFPWDKLPLLSIGRPLIVRAVLGYARLHNIDIIDATETIEALHLTTEDGDKSSWYKPGVHCNEILLRSTREGRKIPMGYGHVECARLETYKNKLGRIQLRRRETDKKICKAVRR